MLRQIAPRQIEASDGVWQRIALVDGHSVRNAVARVERFAFGFSGASVSITECSSDSTRSSFTKVWCQIFSISSHDVTMPCPIGYFSARIPFLDIASSPTYESFVAMPTITLWWRGRPTNDGKTARGASSPAKPAFTIPEPLSMTKEPLLSPSCAEEEESLSDIVYI